MALLFPSWKYINMTPFTSRYLTESGGTLPRSDYRFNLERIGSFPDLWMHSASPEVSLTHFDLRGTPQGFSYDFILKHSSTVLRALLRDKKTPPRFGCGANRKEQAIFVRVVFFS